MNTQQCLTESKRMNNRSKRRNNHVKLNVERMRVALDAEVFTMPKGLTREQKRQFIIGSAD